MTSKKVITFLNYSIFHDKNAADPNFPHQLVLLGPTVLHWAFNTEYQHYLVNILPKIYQVRLWEGFESQISTWLLPHAHQLST